ncbi:MAG: hypothetical protein ACRYF2_13265 [Janthinobacterium lividum]
MKATAAEFGTVIASTMGGNYETVLGWSGLLDPDSNNYSGQALNIATYANPHAKHGWHRMSRSPDDRRHGSGHYE